MKISTYLKIRPFVPSEIEVEEKEEKATSAVVTTPETDSQKFESFTTVLRDVITFTRQNTSELCEESFRFDLIFPANTTDEEFYDHYKPNVLENLQPSLHLLFGAKNSGKTTALYGYNESGLLIRLLHDLSINEDLILLEGSFILIADTLETFDLVASNPYISEIENLSPDLVSRQFQSLNMSDCKGVRKDRRKISLSTEQSIIDFLLLAESNRWIYEKTLPHSRYDTILTLTFMTSDGSTHGSNITFRTSTMYIIEIGNILKALSELEEIRTDVTETTESVLRSTLREAITDNYCFHLLGCINDSQNHCRENFETCRHAVALKALLHTKDIQFGEFTSEINRDEGEEDSKASHRQERRDLNATEEENEATDTVEQISEEINQSDQNNSKSEEENDQRIEEMTLDEMDLIPHHIQSHHSKIRCRVCGHKKSSICTTCSRYFQITIGICRKCLNNHFYRITSPDSIHHLMKHVDSVRKARNLPPFLLRRDPEVVADIPEYQEYLASHQNKRKVDTIQSSEKRKKKNKRRKSG